MLKPNIYCSAHFYKQLMVVDTIESHEVGIVTQHKGIAHIK